jgi:hypothetical protein
MYNFSESAGKLNNEHTIFLTLKRGVKQGVNLTPTLFNYFINDLHEIFDDSCDPFILQRSKLASLSFADDIIILSTSHHNLQNALKKLEDYCYKWKLTVNVKKTKVMTFQKSYSPTSQLYYRIFH